MLRSRSTRQTRGFSLIEVALAASLGTTLLVLTMQTTGDYLESVTELEQADVGDLDRALERIARDVRRAWWVQSPALGVLEVADGRGDIVRYEQDGTSLKVIHPNGDVGTLATGLADVVFSTETMERLREGGPKTLDGVILEEADSTYVESLSLGQGSTLRLAFTLGERHGQGPAPGVVEKLLYAVPETLSLNVGHGYWSNYTSPHGALELTLTEAAGPNDARPRPGAEVLGSTTILSSSLPRASVDGARVPAFQGGQGRPQVWVCHEGEERIVGLDDLMDHVSHGDLVGGCSRPVTDLFAPPASRTTLDFFLSGAELRPGVAYSLSLSPTGQGAISVLAARHVASSPAVLRSENADTPGSPWNQEVPFTLRGQRVVTTTRTLDVVSSVIVTIVPADGAATRSVVAPVFSQVLAEDPWRGVVPGELAPKP